MSASLVLQLVALLAPAPAAKAAPAKAVKAAKHTPASVPFKDAKTGKWGLKQGEKVVLAPRFEQLDPFEKGQHVTAALDEKVGFFFVHRSGKVIARAFNFDNGPDAFVQGRARIQSDAGVGVIDNRGAVVVPPGVYPFIQAFEAGRATVCQGCKPEKHGEHTLYTGGKWGEIDLQGKLVTPLKPRNAPEGRR